ncbi:MAG: EamA family transporter, partial [Candidatus Eremiobacterota bacterium]
PPPLEGRSFLLVSLLVYVLDGLAWILYYRSILIGPISIVGTLSAAYPALTVLLASVFLHERLSAWQYLGVALVLCGCAGLSYSPPDPEGEPVGRGWIPLAAGALLLWGGGQTLLKYAYTLPHCNEANAMLFMIAGGWMTLGVYGLAWGRRPAREGDHAREWLHSMLPMGMMAGGDAALTVATRYGPVSVVGPLTAAYPVVTIAFARVVLKEKITRLQYASVAATLMGMLLTVA